MRGRQQAGLAMVVVLWVLSLMTIMAGSFALTMRRESTIVSAIKETAVKASIAETGIGIAQNMLMLKDKNKRWRADGSIYTVAYQDAEIRIRLFAEHGKIDINKAQEVLLMSMMEATSVSMEKQQEIVSAILDWRDKDDLVRINGAEKKQYDEAGLAYHPANNDFQLKNELQMLLGMDSTLFQEIEPLVTVYSKQANIALDVASKEVLLAIAKLDPTVLDEYLLQRAENNRMQIPAPAFPITEANLATQKTSKNEVYTIISQAKINDEVGTAIQVTLKKATGIISKQPFQPLDWQQVHQKHSLFDDEMEQLLITSQDEPEYEY